MPRTEPDEWDDPSPRSKSGSNTVLIVLLIAGGAGLLAVAGFCLVGGLLWTRPGGRPADDRERPAVGAEVKAARDEAVAARDAAQDAADDRAQADYLARHAALAKGRDAQIEVGYRRLTPAQRAAVDDLRAAIAQRPAVELTDAQRATLDARSDLLRHTDVLAYRLALADQHGGRGLARLLQLTHDPAILFRLAYGAEPPDRRARIRAALERAAERGPGRQGDEDQRLLAPYRAHLRRLPQ